MLDLVTSLVEKSLVMVKQEDGWSRYGMLETIRSLPASTGSSRAQDRGRYGLQQSIRDFAHGQLIKRDDLAATAARHCHYYVEFAKKARQQLHGLDQAEWTRRMEMELDNLRAAIALALAGGVDPVIAVKLEVALTRFRSLRGYSTEGRNNVRAALTLPGIMEPTAARAHALYTGRCAGDEPERPRRGDADADGVPHDPRTLGNTREIAATLSTLSTQYLHQDEAAKARDCGEQALELFRELGDRIGKGSDYSTSAASLCVKATTKGRGGSWTNPWRWPEASSIRSLKASASIIRRPCAPRREFPSCGGFGSRMRSRFAARRRTSEERP